ncbi:MAG: hypothetical protein FJY29_02745 [Betaproteobacteria bacterium]|nr:hypothetical protein [Betaproteobacteria bacterium]
MVRVQNVLVVGFAVLTTAASACRKVDSSQSNSMATKPSELFSTNARQRCLDRAASLPINNAQQSTLCEGAASSAPVDCFKKKTQQGVSADLSVVQCRGVR